MILVDANLLVYAYVESFPQHTTSREWLDGQINSPAPTGLPWNKRQREPCDRGVCSMDRSEWLGRRRTRRTASAKRRDGYGALPWPSLLAFVRLVSNPRIFDRPAPVSVAWGQAESWLAEESVWIPLPTERHQEILAPLVASAEGRANLVPDAHLAALAIEHGLVLCSADGDFARFDGLEWRNPLK